MQQVTDTDPEAAAFQLRLLREATPARRAALALSLSRSVIELSRASLASRMPAAGERDVALRFVSLVYGEDLARELEAHLAATRR